MSVNDPMEWARYAEQDWQVATSLIRRKHPPNVAICFHAQQSAEVTAYHSTGSVVNYRRG